MALECARAPTEQGELAAPSGAVRVGDGADTGTFKEQPLSQPTSAAVRSEKSLPAAASAEETPCGAGAVARGGACWGAAPGAPSVPGGMGVASVSSVWGHKTFFTQPAKGRGSGMVPADNPWSGARAFTAAPDRAVGKDWASSAGFRGAVGERSVPSAPSRPSLNPIAAPSLACDTDAAGELGGTALEDSAPGSNAITAAFVQFGQMAPWRASEELPVQQPTGAVSTDREIETGESLQDLLTTVRGLEGREPEEEGKASRQFGHCKPPASPNKLHFEFAAAGGAPSYPCDLSGAAQCASPSPRRAAGAGGAAQRSTAAAAAWSVLAQTSDRIGNYREERRAEITTLCGEIEKFGEYDRSASASGSGSGGGAADAGDASGDGVSGERPAKNDATASAGTRGSGGPSEGN
eukprot:TRINITY_DN13853_c0_g1_i1.p1 TRINITY_DN13853_c0_g1~~TRINITY_DN13853_c0_g1_i1.p1  ORF type:complete len:435 (+),score=99.20 TRINITY_DN13853_c0_g1_i1:84-1307(+)